MTKKKTIAAIETSYAGRKFRSRLEARWACALDKLGITWEYEQNAFELPSGSYLPDFLLRGMKGVADQDGRVWLEIKPDDPHERPRDNRWPELAILSQIPVLVACGMPRGEGDAVSGDSRGEGFIGLYDVDGTCDAYLAFAVCTEEECGAIGVTAEGRPDAVCDHAAEEIHEHPRVSSAFKAAHAMRFEAIHTRRGV
jgi:hypothetical protein